MSAIAALSCRELADRDPFAAYAHLRRQGPVLWDAGLQAWVVTDYAHCAAVLLQDDLFNRADRLLSGGRAVRGNARALAVLDGEEHAALHRMLTRLMDRKASARYRAQLIRPTTQQLIDGFASRGHVDLAAEYADQLPIRIGLALVGVDTSDPAIPERIRYLKAETARWHETFGENADDVERAVRAAAELKAFFLPIVRERRDHPREDLTSELWKAGPRLRGDWNEEDTYAGLLSHLGGGETQYALRNMIYLLLTQPPLQEQLRENRATLIPRFVEESLRLIGVLHWAMRVAAHDTELAGVSIGQGERVLPLIASANRDAARFDRPDEGEINAPNQPTHLAFGLGPRFCIGSSLARAEAFEAIDALLARFRWLRPDEAAEPPRLGALRVRSFAPLFARFEE
jgi:cytochrome P450